MEDIELAVLRGDAVIVENWRGAFHGGTEAWCGADARTKALVADIQTTLLRTDTIVISDVAIFGIAREFVADISDAEIVKLHDSQPGIVDSLTTSVVEIQRLVSFRKGA